MVHYDIHYLNVLALAGWLSLVVNEKPNAWRSATFIYLFSTHVVPIHSITLCSLALNWPSYHYSDSGSRLAHEAAAEQTYSETIPVTMPTCDNIVRNAIITLPNLYIWCYTPASNHCAPVLSESYLWTRSSLLIGYDSHCYGKCGEC